MFLHPNLDFHFKNALKRQKLNIVLYLKGGFFFDTVSYSSNKCFFYYSDIERFNIMFYTRDLFLTPIVGL